MRGNSQFSANNLPLSRQSGNTIGFVLSQEQFTQPDLLEFGVAAGEAGFGAVWTSDHIQPWQDNQGHAGQAWITLAALGQRLPDIPMGTGVTCPTFRYNPAVVAQAFATLGILYPGRIFLGIGTGEALNETASTGQWGDYEERADRMIEAIEIIRRLWSGEMVKHQGHYYTVNAHLYDLPPQPVPIYVAASGTKSMEVAGQYGDGLITDSESALNPEFRAAFEDGARKAGKAPSQLAVIAEHWVVVGDKPEAEKLAPLWQFLPKAWEEFVDNPDPSSIRQGAQQKVSIEEVCQKWVISPEPQPHAEALQKLLDGGVNTVFVHSAQPDQKSVINFYGREVLPRLSSVRQKVRV